MKRNNTLYVPNFSVIWSLILSVYLIVAHEFRRYSFFNAFMYHVFDASIAISYICFYLPCIDYCMHSLLLLFYCRLLVTRFEQSISSVLIVRHERLEKTSRALANWGSSNLPIRWFIFSFLNKSNPRPEVLFCVQCARLTE